MKYGQPYSIVKRDTILQTLLSLQGDPDRMEG